MAIQTTTIDGETWFKITDHDRLRPFFMSVVSNSNHWMFISSNGGLTAGRKNSHFALFPYYTDDKITESADFTGSKTIFRVRTGDSVNIWEPFSERYAGRFSIRRNLYKSFYGNKIMFEELNHDLGLTFRYHWNSSNLYGFVRKSELVNTSDTPCRLEVLDGIQNILPYGVEPDLQTSSSNLVDAYKRSELIADTGLGIYALSAIISDKAEPSEALKANIVWSLGIAKQGHLLSSLQLDSYRKAQPVQEEHDIKGEKGAYFVLADLELKPGKSTNWKIIANVNQNHGQIIGLNRAISEDRDLDKIIVQDIERGTRELRKLTAAADGLRLTADPIADARHYSNVLFNIMRGGTFDENYLMEKQDVVSYLKNASREVAGRNAAFLDTLKETFYLDELTELLDGIDDPDLYRLCKEYLPLKFSRRHGDPSRPWNKFSINTHSETDGSKILDYQGNWRDIFQNWEALVHSYPVFIEGMIFKFLNATTFDGYNPYRVTKGGFDWEVIEPDNPWSYIGYWGDHQIIYLLKFLEFYQKHEPDALEALFGNHCFVYANVPYRIKPYKNIILDPKNTIDFDTAGDLAIRENVAVKGADAALLGSAKSDIHRVNFLEKILATVLSKMSNFIPEGGIWMNTQRPEWNDANNALVGNGVSMVTLYYLRRFLKFFEGVIAGSRTDKILISEELAGFFNRVVQVLDEHRELLGGRIDDINRKKITDALGRAGCTYRTGVYHNGFSGEKTVLELEHIAGLIRIALEYLEHSIEANRRPDHLYHAYNLMSYHEDGIPIEHLSEMLEGQVAVLSSGYPGADEAVNLLDALRKSALYREDQNSYMLYPDKQLPRFLQKNNIPESMAGKSRLLQKLVADGNHQLVSRDELGGYHFNGNFRNSRDVKAVLAELKEAGYEALVLEETETVLRIFEEVFNHKAFTGRSGTFYAFEGLGSIYWHMVSKLHLAVQEVCLEAINGTGVAEIAELAEVAGKAANAGSSANAENPKVAGNEGSTGSSRQGRIISSLLNHYYEIGEGIGIHKSPEVYGAFPTDPYSHTPKHRGAQQPGMTGQVKEDILVSIGELGAFVEQGRLIFEPRLLRQRAFRADAGSLEFVDVEQKTTPVELPEKALCFSYCQVPVIYRIAGEEGVEVRFADQSTRRFNGTAIDEETSQLIFRRTGEVIQITVSLPAAGTGLDPDNENL
ncbi:MAG: hypothetical protein EA364_03310 [Balneolaceae bacterium]|nr:MAG: hypothetical protein EA364_03310 [Balneolaceae bacterium]